MIRGIAILLWLAAALVRADSPGNSLAAAGVAEFTAAYQAWDGARFKAAADLFRQACTNAPGSCTNFYWLGAAEFHRALQLRSLSVTPANTLATDAALDAALAALLVAVKLDNQHAESHALLGTIYGMKINGNLLRAARFGPRVSKHRDLALASSPNNPRVRYLLGTCQFHTAKGTAARREALASFLLAEKLFAVEARQPAGPLDPRWGHSSCLTFIGRTYELLGQRAEAADYFRRALLEHPADYVAKAGLERVTQKK
jgi:tetratricopeptide (TPR) repeat protein